jgi:hypothetical protein
MTKVKLIIGLIAIVTITSCEKEVIKKTSRQSSSSNSALVANDGIYDVPLENDGIYDVPVEMEFENNTLSIKYSCPKEVSEKFAAVNVDESDPLDIKINVFLSETKTDESLTELTEPTELYSNLSRISHVYNSGDLIEATVEVFEVDGSTSKPKKRKGRGKIIRDTT